MESQQNSLVSVLVFRCMYPSLRARSYSVGLVFAGEVADQLFFLRVDADHGLACGQIPGLELGDVFKLGAPLRVRAHGLFLACLALTQAVLFDQLSHHVATCRRAPLVQTAADFAAIQVRLQHALPHRVSRRELGQQRAKIFVERGNAVDQGLASTAFFRTRLGAGSTGSANSVNPRRTVLASKPNRLEMALLPPLPSLAASIAA